MYFWLLQLHKIDHFPMANWGDLGAAQAEPSCSCRRTPHYTCSLSPLPLIVSAYQLWYFKYAQVFLRLVLSIVHWTRRTSAASVTPLILYPPSSPLHQVSCTLNLSLTIQIPFRCLLRPRPTIALSVCALFAPRAVAEVAAPAFLSPPCACLVPCSCRL